MKKTQKIKKLVGAVICFNVKAPFSGEGELEQHVVLLVDKVYRAISTGELYVCGIALKRLNNSREPQYRQYKVANIEDRTLAIICDNKWTKTQPQLTRLTDKRARVVKPSHPMMKPKLNLGKLKRGNSNRRRLRNKV